jgi:hypothetical protein
MVVLQLPQLPPLTAAMRRALAAAQDAAALLRGSLGLCSSFPGSRVVASCTYSSLTAGEA